MHSRWSRTLQEGQGRTRTKVEKSQKMLIFQKCERFSTNFRSVNDSRQFSIFPGLRNLDPRGSIPYQTTSALQARSHGKDVETQCLQAHSVFRRGLRRPPKKGGGGRRPPPPSLGARCQKTYLKAARNYLGKLPGTPASRRQGGAEQRVLKPSRVFVMHAKLQV